MTIVSIIDRIKKLKGLDNDVQVADILGMKRTALAERKRKGSIPYEELVSFSDKEGIWIDWMLTGEGAMRRDECQPILVKERTAPYGLQADSDVAEIMEILERDLPELKKYVLKFLRGTKERKEGAQGLGLPDPKAIEEGS